MTIPSPSAIALNDFDALLSCGLQGMGLIQTARYMALPHLQSGALVEVLPEWCPAPVPMSLVYLHRHQLSPRIRAFSDWIADIFACCPLLSGGNETTDHGSCHHTHAVKKPELSESATLTALAERRNLCQKPSEYV